MRVVKRLVYTILSLYVGGTILTTFGAVMNQTESPFYTGLSLIGWTVGQYPLYNASHGYATCASGASIQVGRIGSNCITNVSGAGVLSVVGIVAIASVVMEFVSW